MKKLIEDIELTQGDSSSIYFLGSTDNRVLDGNWNLSFVVKLTFYSNPLITRVLERNDGTGEGDIYTTNTKFVFQLLPEETALLEPNNRYFCALLFENSSLNYKREYVFRLKITHPYS